MKIKIAKFKFFFVRCKYSINNTLFSSSHTHSLSSSLLQTGSVLGGLIALVLVTLIIIVLCVAVTRSRTVSHGNKFKEGWNHFSSLCDQSIINLYCSLCSGELTDYYNVQPPGSSRETTSFAVSWRSYTVCSPGNSQSCL